MEDFTNPNLQLVLGVREGTNFDRVQKPTIIIATLNGQFLETKKVQPDANPQYSTDLIWATDKNSLRKMRCNQTPIKVECYAINENSSRERLGYILLSVRCAQVIHKNESDIKTNWYNILGVKNDFNHCKPKLLLYLVIRENNSKIISTLTKDHDFLQPYNSCDNIRPIWLQEEGLIQLGPLDTSHDIFLLNITADHAKNLSQLIKEFTEPCDQNLTFYYNILNLEIKLQSFKIGSDKMFLKEKVILKIRSALLILANYLKSKSHFFVSLKKDNITLIQSEVNLESMLSTGALEEYRKTNTFDSLAMEYYCIFKNNGDYRNRKDISKLPYLKINIRLQHIDFKDNANEKGTPQFCDSSKIQIVRSEVIPNVNLQNSEKHLNHNFMGSNSNLSILDNYEKCNNEKQVLCRSSSNEIMKCDNIQNDKSADQALCTTKDDICIQSHRSYCLNIYLNSVRFLDSKPDIKNIEFRFYYQHGKLITAISNMVSIFQNQILQLKNIHCKLHLISSPNEIEKLLTYFAPKINICDSTCSNKKCIAQTIVDVKQLFRNEDKFECRYETSIIDCQSYKEIGFLDITLHLEDHTLSTLTKIREGFSVTESDNSLAYKIVDELETWKERQKEIFKEEIRKKEEVHLTLLNEEWQKRRKGLETKLGSSIQQCQTLANHLNKTMENFKLRKIQSLEKETQLIQTNEELQWKYDRKLHHLQDALQNMKGDFMTKLFNLEEQNRNLMSQIKKLTEEKLELERMKTDQASKLNSYKKICLTEDQTTSVLQQLKNLEEKLDNAQKSKLFFKEQWGKAVKEIHRIKKENQEAIESQIKNSKEKLNNLDLEEILNADSAALTHDQIALNQIQQEIDVLNPDFELQRTKACVDDELFIPPSELNSNLNLAKSDFSTTSSSESDRRLNMLLEERDTLLKSGSYTVDDSIIINLNSEIRSRLMN